MPATRAHADEPRYRIGEAARKIGISTHVLRAWERRYGLVKPNRTSGEERRYSDSDVERLSLIKRLSDFGYALAEVAAQTTEELKLVVSRLEAYATTRPLR